MQAIEGSEKGGVCWFFLARLMTQSLHRGFNFYAYT